MSKLVVGNISFAPGNERKPPDTSMVYSSTLTINLLKMQEGQTITRIAGKLVCALVVEIFKKQGYNVICEMGGYGGADINILPERGKDGKCIFPFKTRKKETFFLKKYIYPIFDNFETISVDTPVGLTKP